MDDLVTYIYVIGTASDDRNPRTFGNPVKVGIAANPESRLKELQTGNPRRLVLQTALPMPDRQIARKVEQMFHDLASPKMLVGEWFELSVVHAIGILCHMLKEAFEFVEWSAEDRDEFLRVIGVHDHLARAAELLGHKKPGNPPGGTTVQ